MKTQEILTIIALSALGLCLLCGLAKMAMKNPKKRSDCDKACGVFSDPTSCSMGSNCHAKPVSLMRDPYWSIGSVESDPLMFMMSNVGDARGRIQNFMGE